ncbi:Crp/Fnr family transcriptional regulator [Acetobacter sp.]|jgi:CRP-like cAMP-binding protein|uniref:Crp/Fnr family transcriptional regulator n=1 Tax=Acetobacter sp. TaxID=440 RepID=UPI0025C1DE22|nr:Crp/Fnr family transcriptional regulator [Acetobacter sp.]MCH4090332.1 Crp/Fnr family transcriptional regulator [Acetobacter sp.]MCI1299026.1 Crp/Fnr family transcriptional regulator [Acetobacter sp.]MCI1315046.1 Crp/Fnr family transcriptional regulator [Acetobacter sp.]
MKILAVTLPKVRICAVGQWPADRIDRDGFLILDDVVQKEIANIASLVSYECGEHIYAQEAPEQYIYVPHSGAVRVSHQLADGRNQIVAFYMPGEPFGLGENGVYLNSACALTDCLLVRVPRAALDALCEHEPRLQQDCLVGAMAQLRLSQRHLLIVTHQRALKRVADFLRECSRQQEVFDPVRNVLSLIMDRSDIADYLGTSVETVSRMLGKLEEEGLVKRLDARSLWLDLPRLNDLLDN